MDILDLKRALYGAITNSIPMLDERESDLEAYTRSKWGNDLYQHEGAIELTERQIRILKQRIAKTWGAVVLLPLHDILDGNNKLAQI
jgi:hypothetical protein